MAMTAERQGRIGAALEHAKQALALLQAEGDHAGSARALNAVGWFSTQVGDYDEALRCCAQALSLSGEYSDPTNEAGARDTMGYAHHPLGRHPRRTTYFHTALRT